MSYKVCVWIAHLIRQAYRLSMEEGSGRVDPAIVADMRELASTDHNYHQRYGGRNNIGVVSEGLKERGRRR